MKKSILLLSVLFCWGGLKAQYSDLRDFTGNKGQIPSSSLLRVGNRFFGTTNFGGAYGFGVVFSVDTTGTNYKDIHNFDSTNGNSPNTASYMAISGGTLFGTAQLGGTNNNGVVFSLDTSGNNFKVLHYFNITDGKHPEDDVILLGKTLYGMAETGGANGYGNIYSVDTAGNDFKDIFDFNGTNGAYSWGDFIYVGNRLFGMTNNGGTADSGVIFSIDTTGNNYKDLHDFNRGNDSYPTGALIHSGNMLYGMASGAGGGTRDGAVFSIDTAGNGYKVLFDFTGANGQYPYGAVTLSGKLLYGMTESGGANGYGNIFSIDTNGIGFTDLYDFNGTMGANSFGSLTISGNLLYGTTSLGGIADSGVMFSFKDTRTTGINKLTAISKNISVCPNPNNGNFTLQLSVVSGQSSVEIYNELGEQIYTQSNISSPSFSINISSQPNGVYLYRVIKHDGSLAEGKIVIEK